MNLQDRVTALMFAENDRVLSRVTPRFFALWEGDTVEMSTVMRSLSGAGLPREEEQLHFVSLAREGGGRPLPGTQRYVSPPGY